MSICPFIRELWHLELNSLFVCQLTHRFYSEPHKPIKDFSFLWLLCSTNSDTNTIIATLSKTYIFTPIIINISIQPTKLVEQTNKQTINQDLSSAKSIHILHIKINNHNDSWPSSPPHFWSGMIFNLFKLI